MFPFGARQRLISASSSTEAGPPSFSRALTGIAAIGLTYFGVLPTAWQDEPLWAARFAILGLLGLWLANAKRDLPKIAGITLVSLLLANQLLSPFLMPILRDMGLITLSPNIDHTIRITGDVMPGMQGIQHITTDARGFRTTKPVDYERKPDGVYRVVAIGGSTTEQIHLDDRKTWTHLLQEGLSGALGREVEVINTGVSGLRAAHHLVTLNHVRAYRPDLVVILMGINDWTQQILETMDENHRWEGRIWRSLNYPDTALVLLSRKIRSALKHPDSASPPVRGDVIEEFNGEYYSRQNDSLSRNIRRSYPGEIKVSERYARELHRLVQECARRELRCIFVNQPTAYHPAIEPELRRRLWMTPPEADFTLPLEDMERFAKAYNTYLVEAVRHQGGAACDVADALPPTTQYFFDDCHYNENGARTLEKAIRSCILRELTPRNGAFAKQQPSLSYLQFKRPNWYP